MRTTLHVRALRPDDAPAVTAILAEMERCEPVDEAYDELEVIEELSSPAIDLARGSVAVLDDEILVAFGALSVSASAATWKASLWGGVHPGHTRRGIGGRVIERLVECAQGIRDSDRPGAPGELKIWVESNRPATAAVAGRAGFQTWRYFRRMRRDLGRPVDPVMPAAGVLIRPYRSADDDAVRLVSNESFADHWGSAPMDAARWQAEFRDSASFRHDQSFVALTAPGIHANTDTRTGTHIGTHTSDMAGFLLTSEFHGDTEHRGYRTGYIARVGVTRSARGRGVASACWPGP